MGDAFGQVGSHCIHIVGQAGEDIPHRVAFKVAHGHTVQLIAHFLAQAVAKVGGYLGHQPALHPLKEGGQQVQPQHHQQALADAAKVDACAAPEFADQAFKDGGGGIAHQAGAKYLDHRSPQRQHSSHQKTGTVLLHAAQQPFESMAVVGRFFLKTRPSAGASSPMHHGGPPPSFAATRG